MIPFLKMNPLRVILGRFGSTSASTLSSENTVKWEKKPWRISAAVSIERLPIVTPDITGMDKKMSILLNQLENEQSLRSDHEMRHLEDM